MNIQKATAAALAINGFISRASMRRYLRIEPSNSEKGFLMHSKHNEVPRPRWQPGAEDLMADDWEVFADLSGMFGITKGGEYRV